MGGQAHVQYFIRNSIFNFISSEKEFYRARYLCHNRYSIPGRGM